MLGNWNQRFIQAKEAEKAKQFSLKTAGSRRISGSQQHSGHYSRLSKRSMHSSRRIESSSPNETLSISGTSKWGANSSLYENLASNSSRNLKHSRKPSRNRLSTRIEEVLRDKGPSLKSTSRLPPINVKSGETRMEALQNEVNKKLEAIRDAYE